jgi:CRP-like cAMP-binding protein
VLTAVIGFALQDTLGNMMGGIALQLDQSINVGDWVVLSPGAPPARVTEIRWRYTAMETTAWSTIIVPNSVLMKGQVTVLGRRQGQPSMMRRDVDFFVDFRTPPGDVIDPVLAAMTADPPARVARVPELQVLYQGIRDSVNVFRARYWLTDLAVDEPTDAEVRTRIYYALQRAGVDFSIPAQTVFVATQDDAREQRHADRELTRRLGAIAKVDLLAMLGDDERRQLAERLHYAPFHRGERMTREGDLDDGLYMIVEGHAAVQIQTPEGSVEVARLAPGQFFGEMSLMTGEKRSATVVAATDMITYRLDKHAFEDLIRSRPPIAEAVAELLTERKIGLDAVRESVDDAARARRRQTTKQDILGRIRGFFNLGR